MRSPRGIWVGCAALTYAAALVLVQACDGDDPAGSGGNGGSGGDACETFGPVNPDACKNEGATCFFADTSCAQTWTCQAGEWETAGCNPTTTGSGGAGGNGGASAGGAGGAGGT